MSRADDIDPDVHFGRDLDRYDERPRTSGKAIAAFILGGASFVLSIFAGIPAIILGIMSVKEIKRSDGRIGGETLAICGIVIGCLTSILLPIMIMIALLLPALATVREPTHRNKSMHNMKLIGLGVQEYESKRREFPAATFQGEGKPDVSWRTTLLPYMERADLHTRYDFESPWDSQQNKPLSKVDIAVLRSPNLEAAPGMTNYLVLRGEETAFPPGKDRIRVFLDGASNTILFVEADDDRAVPWSQPKDIDYNASKPLAGLGNHRPRVILVTFADGSVRAIPNDIAPQAFHAIVTRDGNEGTVDEILDRSKRGRR